MSAKTLNTLGRLTALFSFLIGTGLFASSFHVMDKNILAIGLYYVLFAFFINLLILFMVLLKSYMDEDNRKSLLGTAGLMLLNIPVVLLYLWAML